MGTRVAIGKVALKDMSRYEWEQMLDVHANGTEPLTVPGPSSTKDKEAKIEKDRD